MTARFLKRITQELREALKLNTCNISYGLVDPDDLYNLEACIIGAENTPYYGGVFKLRIQLPPEYPFKPPNVNFITRIFHSNVSNDGNICLDLLKHNWSPIHTIENVLLSILLLMECHNPDDPLNTTASNLFKTNPREYFRQCQNFTRRYASGYSEIPMDIDEESLEEDNYNVIRFSRRNSIDEIAISITEPLNPHYD